ncbi:MAG: 1-acyl-sn-glycerol-3-phosphate acyltransferase [Anaeromyxobacter sp.]
MPGTPSLLQRACAGALRLLGWKWRVDWPQVPRCVVIVYPHTSNWDFAIGYLVKAASGVPIQFIGKHTLFRWPLGPVLRWMGGIPVDRSAPSGFIPAMQAELLRRPWAWVVLAPEGTRSRLDHWKSGFHRLAVGAGVPLGLAFIDWKEKEVGLTAYVDLSGDPERDLEVLRAFYAGKAGRRPELASDIRFRAAPRVDGRPPTRG